MTVRSKNCVNEPTVSLSAGLAKPDNEIQTVSFSKNGVANGGRLSMQRMFMRFSVMTGLLLFANPPVLLLRYAPMCGWGILHVVVA